jgi:sulfite exporter TauE/SafE
MAEAYCQWNPEVKFMPAPDSIYLILLTAGFTTGFGHCIGMCGPIVVSLSLNLKKRSVFLPHLLYNGGRITTYAILGGLMGLTGSFASVISSIAGLQKGVMIFAGMIIIVMGLAMSGWLPLGKIYGDYHNPKGLISKGFRKLTASNSAVTYYPLGLLLGLLPCGPVYTALVTAARAGMEAKASPEGFFMGMGLMLSFGLGTLPALFILAKLSDLGWLKSRDVIYKIGSVLMIVVGVYFVVKGIRY